ncbi:MAG TPA: CNNM domain-containing protein [Candidatus Krumholzibacteria bacterium]|nr:CNNM domain-containing protein [Candidatus Krumholzibacteria bacterium]
MQPILVFALLLLGSAYFSSTELAITMASRVRLRTAAAEGRRLARLAERQLRRRDHGIALCLVGNNLVNVGIAVYGRETLLHLVPLREAAADVLATLLVVPLLLVFGEVLPKAVAQSYPNRVLRFNVLLLLVLRIVLAPLLLLAIGLALSVRRLLGSRGSVLEFASREDLKQFVARSESGGHLDPEERELIGHIVEFWRLDPIHFVRPLQAVPQVHLEASAGAAKERMRATRITRLPVTDASGKDVVGVVSAAALLGADNDSSVARWMTPPVRVRQGTGFDRLLGDLQRSPSQIAVMEGDGEVLGIIRLDDLLHRLMGPGKGATMAPPAAPAGARQEMP